MRATKKNMNITLRNVTFSKKTARKNKYVHITNVINIMQLKGYDLKLYCGDKKPVYQFGVASQQPIPA